MVFNFQPYLRLAVLYRDSSYEKSVHCFHFREYYRFFISTHHYISADSLKFDLKRFSKSVFERCILTHDKGLWLNGFFFKNS